MNQHVLKLLNPDEVTVVIRLADEAEVGERWSDRGRKKVDEGLPLYVTPLRPIERVLAELREWEAATASPPAPLSLI